MDEVNVSSREVEKPVAAEDTKTAEPAVQEAPAPKKRRTAAEKEASEKKTTSARKAAAKPAAEKKTTARAAKKKDEEPKKAAARRGSSKKAEEQAKVILQFAGKDISMEEILNKAKAAFAAEKEGVEIKTMDIYVKPEENAAYYVVNAEEKGKIEL